MNNSLTPCKKGKATHYMVVDDQDAESVFPISLYNITGTLKMKGQSLNEDGTAFHGDFVFFHPNGKTESKGKYMNHSKVGVWERFDAQGNSMAERTYASFDHTKMAYTYVDRMPQYLEGKEHWQEFVKQNLAKYVSSSEDANNRMQVQFIVSEKGHIEDVVFLKGLSRSFDEQAARAIESMPDWTPGKKQGKAVRVLITMPIEL
jgi:antitoxin component YwqK of YwqJK toxin-antitoxin module